MRIEPDTLPTGHAGIAARLKKGPTIHSSAWIVPGATVIGDVTLEEESSVWYGAVLRGDINRIIIGPRSNVQDNAVIHLDTNYPTMVGELVTVGHSAIVHACKIDDEVLVGMCAIVLDDVEVGARCIIGANALVTMGMKIPPGSLVLGSPAKIRRQLSLDEQMTSRAGRGAMSKRRSSTGNFIERLVSTNQEQQPSMKINLASVILFLVATLFDNTC